MAVKLAFRHQRAIFGFVVLGLLILFSTAVLWGHYEKIVSNYQWLAKAGLALVDVIAVGLALWHFYAKHVPLKVWCYIAEGVIAAMMIVHAGAVLQLESSTSQQTHAVQTAVDTQTKLIEAQGKANAEVIAAQGKANAETEAARIKAAGDAAVTVKKQTGSTTLASRTLRAGTTSPLTQPDSTSPPIQTTDGKTSAAIVEQASQIKPKTFLGEGYMNGGIYVWPALIAFGLFFVAIGISAFSEPHEDANRNSIPDSWEKMFGRDVQPINPPQPVNASPSYPPKPRVIWQGGKIVKDERGN